MAPPRLPEEPKLLLKVTFNKLGLLFELNIADPLPDELPVKITFSRLVVLKLL
jgi:hypothetical protein